LELYRERGFDRTTTAEIAARAGVTERTFFRHFPDKREVLFDGETGFHAALSEAIAKAPDALGPMETLLWTFRSMETLFEANRPFTGPAQEVIARAPALRERQLAKTAATTAALAAALQRRGVEANLASLAAGTGMAVFGFAARAWFEDPAVSLGTHLERAFAALNGLSAPRSPSTEPRGEPVPAAPTARV
jgi:AcrR family transcriptional regulator